VIFKNQARGTEDKRKKEFVNVGSPLPLRLRWASVRARTDVSRDPGSAAIGLPQAVHEVSGTRIASLELFPRVVRGD
jgi:hypothetical protein